MRSSILNGTTVLFSLISVAPVMAQSNAAATAKKYLPPSAMRPAFRLYAEAPGSRLRTPGREQMVLTGSLTSKGGSSSTLVLVTEFPAKFRIDEIGGRGRAFTFDGADLRGRSAADGYDEELMESLAFDTADHFLSAWGEGAAARLLGQRFRVFSKSGFGALLDIVETTSRIPVRRDYAVRIKQVMFDSQTGLLRRVAYTAREKSPSVRVETVYSDYSAIDGQQIPGVIRRLENGKELFRFVRDSASFRGSDGSSVNFKEP